VVFCALKVRSLQNNIRVSYTTFPVIFLQLCGRATALTRKFLHDLKTVQQFESFCNMHNKNIYNEN
jgi:hypothetical protein